MSDRYEAMESAELREMQADEYREEIEALRAEVAKFSGSLATSFATITGLENEIERLREALTTCETSMSYRESSGPLWDAALEVARDALKETTQ